MEDVGVVMEYLLCDELLLCEGEGQGSGCRLLAFDSLHSFVVERQL